MKNAILDVKPVQIILLAAVVFIKTNPFNQLDFYPIVHALMDTMMIQTY